MPYPRGQRFLQGVQQMRVLSRLSRTDELPCRYGLLFSTFMLQLLRCLLYADIHVLGVKMCSA